ncbi:MAG: hypothetical protein DHS80DRAFT_17656 [Piptocephalis tieghemiana]|nr:MAG: hypothetical protein DHS80DRAFT_17656 [Piptocephalis tieghemiana]
MSPTGSLLSLPSPSRQKRRPSSLHTVTLEDGESELLRRGSSVEGHIGLINSKNQDGGWSSRGRGCGVDRHLMMEALPTLILAVGGLLMAGWILDVVQHWEVFSKISELFILVPVVLGLKGNLEMNLAARLSTAANLGELDDQASRRSMILGNLALIQLQSLSVGGLAGLLSFLLGLLFHGHHHVVGEVAMMMVTAMSCASLSSFILGSFMCSLCVLSRRWGINPDNVASPIASSLGDLVTLILLAGVSRHLLEWINHPLIWVLLFLHIAAIPLWLRYCLSHSYTRSTIPYGWIPVMAAMVISSMAGLVLERFVERYAGMAVLVPVLNGISQNIACIFCSRLSTALHSGVPETEGRTIFTLLLLNLPSQWLFLLLVKALGLGHGSLDWRMWVAYTFVSYTLVVGLLGLARWLTSFLWHRNFDPDHYALPYLTAMGDVMGTIFLVLSYVLLEGDGSNNPVPKG